MDWEKDTKLAYFPAISGNSVEKKGKAWGGGSEVLGDRISIPTYIYIVPM
jgi:hypothetical protein